MDGTMGDSLFETPRGVRVIPPEFLLADPDATVAMLLGDIEESEQLLHGFDPEAAIRNTRRGERGAGVDESPRARRSIRRTFTGVVNARGSHFIYALVALTLNLGLLGLALSWRDARVLSACLVITPISTVWFWIRLRAWLDRTPYCYRLLTSLGEDAENLLRWSLWRRLRSALGSVRTRSA